MIDTLSFPGVFFCPCVRLEVLPHTALEMPLKRFLRHTNRLLHFYLSIRVWEFPNK